jgi:hypothetical protein
MRWIKVIALVIGVIVVFSLISTLLHAVFWIAVGVAVAAVAVGVLRARNALRGRQEGDRDSGPRATRSAPSHPQLGAQSNPAQWRPDAKADTARLHQEVEDELARLKRELE